jgi:hypothetical protein
MLVLVHTSASASQHLDSDEPEAWAMFYFTSVTLFSGLGTPRARDPGSIEAALELDSIPHLNEEQRTVGFGGTKEEDLNKSPLFARPRITVGLPWKLSLSLAYIPPIEVFHVRPHLFAMAVERPVYEHGPWTLGLRTYGQVGEVHGAYTCPQHVTHFPPGSPENLYGCEKESDDVAMQRYAGLEASGSFRIDRLYGLTPYLTLGANFLDTNFHVHAQTFGFADRTHLSADTWTFSLGTGVSIPIGDRLRVAVGLFYTPLWVTRPPETSKQSDSLLNLRTDISFRMH